MSKEFDEAPSHKRRTSLFHTLKKSMLSGSEKTVDPSFESARADFIRLHDYFFRIRNAVCTYQTALKAVLGASKAVSDGFGDALEDAPRPHPYSTTLMDLRRTRLDLVADRGEGAVALSIDATILKRIDVQLEAHKALLARIADRAEIVKEMDYYARKVDDLRSEREKRSAKGKEEKPADVEKLERNTRKHSDISHAYQTFNASLTNDLMEVWNTRVDALGPALEDFLAVERQVLVLYATAVRDVALPVGGAASANGLSAAMDSMTARAAQAQKDAARHAELHGAQAAEKAATAAQKAVANSQLNGSDAAFASFAASAVVSESQKRQKQPPPPPPPAAMASFDDDVGQAADIFARARSSPPSRQSVAGPSPPPPPPAVPAASASSSSSADPWDAFGPPMLSHIASSGMGVGAAVDFSSMNTDGSVVAVGPGRSSDSWESFGGFGASGSFGNSSSAAATAARSSSPLPPPPVPHALGHQQPAYYGNGHPISPPGGAVSVGGNAPSPPPPPPVPSARPRLSSFGQFQSRGEGEGEGEGEQPRARAPPPKSFNPFDEE